MKKITITPLTLMKMIGLLEQGCHCGDGVTEYHVGMFIKRREICASFICKNKIIL